MDVILVRWLSPNDSGQYYQRRATLPLAPSPDMLIVLDDEPMPVRIKDVAINGSYVLCILAWSYEAATRENTRGWTPVGSNPYVIG